MRKTDTSLLPATTGRNWRRIFIIIGAVLLTLLLIGAAAFYLWASDAAEPMPEATAALLSDEAVVVQQISDWLTFEPDADAPSVGFIFYPGGKVDHRAYAPMLKSLAEDGYLTATTNMPLNLAFFGINKADSLISNYPEIDRWVIGGHSLGGVAAARYARTNPEVIDGLVLWASFPADSDSLAGRTDLTVVSIYGTNDGLMATDTIEESRALLPPEATFIPIEGGNHAQFGWYGEQSGDNAATIEHLIQQEQVVEGTLIALQQQ